MLQVLRDVLVCVYSICMCVVRICKGIFVCHFMQMISFLLITFLIHPVGCCQENENNCLPTYNSYECNTCFRAYDSSTDNRNFEDSHQFCSQEGTDGHLLTFSDTNQLSKISYYLKLNNVNETFWVGLRYIARSNEIVLVDINDNEVQLDIKFEEGTPQPAASLCVSMVSRGDDEASLLREDCNNYHHFICTISSIG